MDTAKIAVEDAETKKKGRAFTRPAGTYWTPQVSGG
jgi:hypothetical protein